MAKRDFRVSWHKSWNADLEAALAALPELEACPRELYKLLLTSEGPAKKKIALIADADGPVALIGLRPGRRFGVEPITNWLIPGRNFMSRPGAELQAAEALGLRTTLAWWRMDARPAEGPGREAAHVEMYGMHTSEDYEAFWRKSGLIKSLRPARKRCAKYRYEINPPGAAEWAIRNWDTRWSEDGGVRASLQDRILVAQYLEPLNRHFTQALYDGDKLIGAATQIAHGKCSVAGIVHYLPEYRNDGVGTRLLEYHFEHARAAGFDLVDIGGGHDYKLKWAHVIGERSTVTLWPPSLRPLQYALAAFRRHKRRAASAAEGGGEGGGEGESEGAEQARAA